MIPDQSLNFSPITGLVEGKKPVERWLSTMKGFFLNEGLYDEIVQTNDRLIYQVTSIQPVSADGQLYYGLGTIFPGKIGDEYHLTAGHFHEKREAAEVYICLNGQGIMLLEEESSGLSQAITMTPNSVVYVPGYTAHRTINIGDEPLVYWGIYPHDAGHDYQPIKTKNFRKVVICLEGQPVVMDRTDYLWKVER